MHKSTVFHAFILIWYNSDLYLDALRLFFVQKKEETGC
ncbi:hypothetical protein M092_1729 [Parabacteroides distasonis str. 3776 D15 iv]|nr:hypothetical protein M092_1729 [Parabacteroides distasonis str. 3776 D15 iv]